MLYRQYRSLGFSVRPEPLTQSMKLNGTDYRASIAFNSTSTRLFRTEAGWDGPRGWGPWKDDALEYRPIAVERRKGTWLISDDELFVGKRPDSAVPSTGSDGGADYGGGAASQRAIASLHAPMSS